MGFSGNGSVSSFIRLRSISPYLLMTLSLVPADVRAFVSIYVLPVLSLAIRIRPKPLLVYIVQTNEIQIIKLL